MKEKVWLLLSVLFAVASGADAAAGEQRRHSAEQMHFGAEDTGVEQPVDLPKHVLAILRKDETVQSVMENENTGLESPPPAWFSASAVHLTAGKEKDLVVVGQPPVSGGSVALFWVFCATASGYALVLTASAHDLEVKNASWKGHRDIELTSLTAVQISKVLCRFNGKQYTKYKVTSGPIR
jgi:hypothetical protein